MSGYDFCLKKNYVYDRKDGWQNSQTKIHQTEIRVSNQDTLDSNIVLPYQAKCSYPGFTIQLE